MKQANLVTKTDFNYRKINSNKTKHLLAENELKKTTNIFFVFRGKSHFQEDGTQNSLVFEPMYRYFKRVINSDYIFKWISKGLSDQSIKSLSASHNFLNPSSNYLGTKTRVRFSGSCSKQDKTTYTHRKIVNIYIGYEINKNGNTSSDLTLRNCFIGAVSLPKNANLIVINILDLELDLINMDFFHILVVELVEM